MCIIKFDRELKDSYVGSDCIEGELPELLKAILQRNPQTLKGFNIHSKDFNMM